MKKKKDLRNESRLTATSIDDFRKKVFDCVTKLNKDGDTKILLLDFKLYQFGDIINTFHCPIDGVTNLWPLSYVGWDGTITIVFSSEKYTEKNADKVKSLIKSYPGLNIGTGGYSGNNYAGIIKGHTFRYSLQLFLDDFPLIKEQYKEFLRLYNNIHLYEQEISRLVNERNSTDIRLATLYLEEKDTIKEISRQSEFLNIVRDSIRKIENENKEEVIKINPFPDAEIYNNLKEIFHNNP